MTARDPDQRDAVALPKDADDIQKVKPAHGRRTQQGKSRPPLLFARADSSLYTSLATLPQRAGVPASMLPWLVVKGRCRRPGRRDAERDAAGGSPCQARRHGRTRWRRWRTSSTIIMRGAKLPAGQREQGVSLIEGAADRGDLSR